MPDSPRRELTDIESLKALAHPLRQRMLNHLQRHGSATSADLAAEFEADRGATSYHLRQLARYGFIEEDVARSAGRRKYWRASAQDLRLPRRPVDAETATAARDIYFRWQNQGEDALQAFLADPDAFGEFGAAAVASFGAVTLTAQELTQFGEEYIALLNRWQRDDVRPDSRHITVLFNAFPTPGEAQQDGDT